MSKLPDPKLLELKFELIHKELDDTKPLFSLLAVRAPDTIEIRAAGSIMQSVYNGLEVVFSLCADSNDLSETNWHRMLLEKAAELLGFADDLQLKLEMLQRFRHKFRHAYGYMLDWDFMAETFLGLPGLVIEVESKVKTWVAAHVDPA